MSQLQPNIPGNRILPDSIIDLSGGTINAVNIYSGGTDLSLIFNSGPYPTTDLTPVYQRLNSKANLSGATFTGPILAGDGVFNGLSAQTVSAFSLNGFQASVNAVGTNTLSAQTIYSGTTNIGNLFASKIHTHVISDVTGLQTALDSKAGTNTITHVQPGVNITTGGTATNPTVNLGDTISLSSIILNDSIEVASLVTTNQLAVTGQANIDAPLFINGVEINNLIDSYSTRVQAGTNIVTGGTAQFPVVSVNSEPIFDALFVTGESNLDGDVYLNGIDINSKFASKIHTHIISDVTGLQNSLNTKANLSGASFTGVISSGGTDLSLLFKTTDNDTITRVQPGSNITTGGTGNNPIINVASSPSFNVINASGTSQLAGAVIPNLSANTVSAFALNGFQSTIGSISSNSITGTTYFSGSTALETVIRNIAIANDTNDITRVQPGLNISTGGTANNPTVNLIASPVIDSLTVNNTASIQYLKMPSGTTSSATAAGGSSGYTYYNGNSDALTFFNKVGESTLLNTQVLVNNSLNRVLDYSYTELFFTGITTTNWILPAERRNFSLTIGNYSNKTLAIKSFNNNAIIWDIATGTQSNTFNLASSNSKRFVSDGNFFFVY